MPRWLTAAIVVTAVFCADAGLPSACFASTRQVDVSDARKAVEDGNWTQAIADWQQLYLQGEREAASQLCGLYFDARQGEFDAARVVDWCRRAAASGDPWARYRMGLLYLTGVGVDRDGGQAQVLCAAAAKVGDPDVPAGFCLAAVAIENERAAKAALQPPRSSPPGSAASDVAGPPSQACRERFAAAMFDAAKTAETCEKAAADGDPEARYRLALMHLVGFGGGRDLAAAEQSCAHVRASGGQVSTAFCAVAVAQLRQASSRLARSQDTGAIDVHPATGLPLPKTEPDPYAGDRVLDAIHATPTELTYTCRQINLWALYEAPGLSVLTPRDTLFGRPIIAYRPADFAALDAAAAACAKDTASNDPRGSLAPNFAAFRRALGALKTRQAALLREQQSRRQDAELIAQVDRDYGTGRFIGNGNVTAQESTCIERVRQAWRSSGQEGRRRSLEIRDTRLVTEGSRFVAYGQANILNLDTTQREVIVRLTFSCTFEHGAGDRVAAFDLQPGFTSRR